MVLLKVAVMQMRLAALRKSKCDIFLVDHCKRRLLLNLYRCLLDKEIGSNRKKPRCISFLFEIFLWSKNTLNVLPYFVKYFGYNDLIDS